MDLQFRRAFLMTDSKDQSKKSIITSKGIFAETRELEVNFNNEILPVVAHSLEEATVSFEHFTRA